MVTLTAFADEISADLQEQLDVLESEGIHHLELRGVWNKNVLDLSDEEVQKVRDIVQSRGFKVSAVGSPIGKIDILDPMEPHVQRFKRALQVAKVLETSYIRIFSFFIPQGQSPQSHRREVLARMAVLQEMAAGWEVVLLHENEKEIYGDNAQRCLDILEHRLNENLACAFDPANFVQCGVKPYEEAFPLLQPYIRYVHIKDALFAGGTVVPAGQGDGALRAVLSRLFAQGYDGFLSLEPHLAHSDRYQGFSGPALFHVAAEALKNLLGELGQVWQ